MPAASPATPARWACPFEQVRELGWLSRARRNRRRFHLHARDESPSVPGRRMRAGAGGTVEPPCGRGMPADRSPKSRRSIGTTPAVWAASTGRTAPVSANDRTDRLNRLNGPQHVRGVSHRHELRLGSDRLLDRVRVDVDRQGRDARQRNAGLECGQWSADGIVFQLAGDVVVARLDDPFDREVQSVGAVQGKDPPLGASPPKNWLRSCRKNEPAQAINRVNCSPPRRQDRKGGTVPAFMPS